MVDIGKDLNVQELFAFRNGEERRERKQTVAPF